jgi:hypothetical protein
MTVSQTWAAKSDFLIADYGSTLALPNILAAEAAKKVIFVPVSSSSIVFRCRDTWMAHGLQPQCAKAGDKRFPHAFSMYVNPFPCYWVTIHVEQHYLHASSLPRS